MARRQGTPFPFEGPVPRDLLIGRTDDLQLLARRAADRVNVRLVAPRRFGKTSLVLAHAGQLRESGWRTVHVDLSLVADLTDVARRVAAGYAHLNSPWVREHLSGLLGSVGVSLSAAGPGVTLGPRPAVAPSDAAESVLLALLDLPLTLSERDQDPTLVVFDEFQDLLKTRGDLDGLLRSRIQYHQDAAAYVFAGSEPSMMRAIFDSRERPLFGQAMPLVLGPLPADVLISDLLDRFTDEGLDPGGSLGDLVVIGGGHPQRTMLFAYLLAEALAAGDEGTPALTERVVRDAIRLTDPAHRALWQTCAGSERAVLAAVADGLPPTSQVVADQHKVAKSTLGAAADRLADRGHLFRTERGSQIVDPLLAAWLRTR